MEGTFGLIEQVNFTRTKSDALTGQFTANTSCGAGDENHLAFNLCGNGVVIEFDGITLQQIFDADTFDLVKTQLTVDPFRSRRHIEHTHLVIEA